jgi:1-deoxy-D-xylulose-5-phosphate synthase
VLARGRDVAVFAYGNTVDIALDAQDLLADGPVVTVVNARFAKPLDEALLIELARDHSHIITLEEHALAGGFGSAVAEFVSDRGLDLRVERIGVPNVLVHHDSQDKQRAQVGLSAESLASSIKQLAAGARQSAAPRTAGS